MSECGVEQGDTRPRQFATLFGYAWPYRQRLALIGFLMVLNSAATLAIPWLLGHVAGGIVARETSASGNLVPILLVCLFLVAVLSAASDYVAGDTSARITADLREKIYAHLQRLPIPFHRAHRQGDILALMTREVSVLTEFVAETIVSILPMLLTAAGAIVLMLRIDERLALAIPALLPLFYIALRMMRRPMRDIARKLQEAEADVVASTRQNLEMIPMIKVFAREDSTQRQFGILVDRARGLLSREFKIYAVVPPMMGFVAATAAVILLVVMDESVETGSMTPGEMLSFLFYAALLTRPASGLAQLYGQVQRARGALDRMLLVLEEPHEAGYLSTRRFKASRGEIRFSHLQFGYPGRDEVITDVDLLIEGGETVAIAGHNGAGKSTMISLLLRFYQPVGGAIYIDGEDIASVNLQDLRRQFGYVSQEIMLFNGTIHENIAYGLEGATAAQIAAAVTAARADDFLDELPQGLDTRIGDSGIFLSGGQRQRVALARALLKDPPIILLDEANSMYDLEGEAAFIEACARTLESRTAILISHREATLSLADRIVRLDHGVIREA